MAIPAFALPGDPLAPSSTYLPGPGTHLHASQLYASVAGPVSVLPPASKKSLPSLTIAAAAAGADSVGAAVPSAALPKVGDVVLGRVTRTNPRQATLDILALAPPSSPTAPGVGIPQPQPQPLREPFQALIRQQDIRATETDKVKVAESFRVGDVVRAVVISVGDERNYYASTARNEFGVVMAWSEAGRVMAPVSWREMREVGEEGGLGCGESRKVAKPV